MQVSTRSVGWLRAFREEVVLSLKDLENERLIIWLWLSLGDIFFLSCLGANIANFKAWDNSLERIYILYRRYD